MARVSRALDRCRFPLPEEANMSAWNGLSAFIRSRLLRAFSVLALLASLLVTGAMPGVIGAGTTASAMESCDGSALPPPSDTTVDPGVATTIVQDGATV